MKRCPFLAFVFGLFSGILLGMLISPKSGKELRNELTIRANDTKENLKKKASDMSYDIDGVKDTIKDTITLYTGASIQELQEDEQSLYEKEFEV